MSFISPLDAFAAAVAAAVVGQAVTLGAIQVLRIQDRHGSRAVAQIAADRRGSPRLPDEVEAGTWLAITLALAAVQALGDLLQHLGWAHVAYWFSPLHGAALLLVGPAMWLYARAITRSTYERSPTWRHFAVHAVPAGLLMLAVAIFVALDPWTLPEQHAQRAWAEVIILIPIALQILVYLGAVVWRVRRQRPRLEELFSHMHHRQLRWLEVAASAFSLLVMVWIVSWTLPIAVSNIMTNAMLGLSVAVLGVFGARQSNVFSLNPWLGSAPARHPMTPPLSGSDASTEGGCAHQPDPTYQERSDAFHESERLSPKYAKSAMPAALAEAIAERIRACMAADKLYLECDLTLADLAIAVDATPHQVSQVLSIHLAQSFFEYINALRVEAVKATLARPQSVGRPLLEIALECGFGSKSAFNEAFKRTTGLSPGAYRKALPAVSSLVREGDGPGPAGSRGSIQPDEA